MYVSLLLLVFVGMGPESGKRFAVKPRFWNQAAYKEKGTTTLGPQKLVKHGY